MSDEVWYNRILFTKEAKGAAATQIELTYENALTTQEAAVFELAIIEGWHAGQMRVQVMRKKTTTVLGRATDEAMRQGLGGEGPVDAIYTETSHDLAAEEAERLRAQVKTAERYLVTVEDQRDAALLACEKTAEELREEAEKSTRFRQERDYARNVAEELRSNLAQVQDELAKLRNDVQRLISRHAKT